MLSPDIIPGWQTKLCLFEPEGKQVLVLHSLFSKEKNGMQSS